MDTRFKKKRRRIVVREEDDSDSPEVSNVRYKRSKIENNQKIIPYEPYSKACKETSATSYQEKDYAIISRIVPSLNLTRIDIATPVNLNDCAKGCTQITEQTNRKEEMTNFEFSSIKRTSTSGFRGYETITRKNISSVVNDPEYIPISEFNSTFIKKKDNSVPDDDNTRQQVLRDVKNVKLNDTTIKMLFKGVSGTSSSPRGQENIVQPTRKINEVNKVYIDYDEISLSERILQKNSYVTNTKLVVSLQRVPNLNYHRVVEESTETSSKTEENLEDRPTEISKNFKIQKVCSSLETIEESREKKVRNMPKSEIIEDEQTPLSQKGSSRNLRTCLANIKSRGALKKTAVKFDEILEYELANHQSKIKKNGKKKTLNVSFKEETDVIDNLPIKLNRKAKLRANNENLATSTPCRYDDSVLSANSDGDTEEAFRGFSASVDLSAHSSFCSFVLNSVSSCLKEKTKKLMSKKEAAEKTKVVNLCKKALENSQLPQKSSQRLATKRMQRNLTAKSIIATEVKQCLMNNKIHSPYIKLNKLSEGDISSYKITPLREERVPIKPKTKYDYGIDDVNTDDSTDEEDNPKKIVPNWAVQFRETLKKFNPHEKIPRMTIKQWIKPPELTTSLRYHIFYKLKRK